MKQYTTELRAWHDNQLKKFAGDNIEANSFEEAENWCKENKAYLTVTGELVSEVPCKEGTLEPDWDKQINYD